ncbi:translation initiation factor IF-2-like [Falco biarmicus]|uniref:translation initiation factor IF-2-like n=1 Tax=Falco biarmicus TaxID=345155 RepID=UPI0024BC40E6|nr:translation initiation factor IF-2-like [Falco biarmicus]
MMRAMGGAGARGSGGRRSPGEGRGCAGRRDRAARGPSGGGGRRETLNPRLPPLRSLARSPPLCLSGDFSSCCRHGGEGVEEEEEEGGGGGGTLRRLPPPRTRGQRRRLPAPPRARPDRKTAVTDGAAAGRAGGGRAGSTGGWRAALGRGPPGRGGAAGELAGCCARLAPGVRQWGRLQCGPPGHGPGNFGRGRAPPVPPLPSLSPELHRQGVVAAGAKSHSPCSGSSSLEPFIFPCCVPPRLHHPGAYPEGAIPTDHAPRRPSQAQSDSS